MRSSTKTKDTSISMQASDHINPRQEDKADLVHCIETKRSFRLAAICCENADLVLCSKTDATSKAKRK